MVKKMEPVLIALIIMMVAIIGFSNTTYAATRCPYPACDDYVTSGKKYCSKHACREDGCNNVAVDRYCSTHKCKRDGCNDRYWYTDGKYKGYCNTCAWKVADGTYSATTSKTASSSSKTDKSNSSISKTNANRSTTTQTNKTTSSSSTTKTKVCAYPKCRVVVKSSGLYCTEHTCSKRYCYSKRRDGSVYCENHSPASSGSKTSSNSNNNSSSSNKKNSSKKVEMPDCDDYDSYEDFMDDWDGFMPDGSDAEDYWENW